MNLVLNGERKKTQEGLTIAALLNELGIKKEHVAVELNLDIVPKARFADTLLKDGDRLEIVSFVGGGA